MSTNDVFQSPPFLKGSRPQVGGMFLLEKGAWAFVLLCLMLGCCAGCSVRTNTKAVATASTTRTHTALSATKTLYFKVLGKASLSDGKRHAQISLRWQQRGEHYVINLYGPLGSGAVRLSNANSHLPASSSQSSKHPRSRRSAVYYQDMKGEVRSYGSAEKLLEQECGWRLPISGLAWWLRGLPRPEETAIIVRDKAALITQIAQDGWTIKYLSYQSIKGKTYPHKVQLSRDKLRLKFVLRDWHIDTKTSA